ncbi:unnamed protein product [Cuscuta campestris]|uniref:Retrotransposon gag domain-containing protein n=1 Tax=Cuscuta campestris TaxID=132261 RepID=A0A484MCT5_9ASTE|nr:unnamed protein product [Cuscuta campestris]
MVLKAEKYFRYYDVPEDDKVDVASMYLEGDALDLFSWMSTKRTLFYWEDLVKAFQEHYGPPEYQNPNEYLCSIKQSGTVTEYRLEFARRASQVERRPEHCLLGVFINGLKEELRPDVRLHKPQTVYMAASLALEFERKQPSSRGSRSNAAFGPNRSNPLYPQNYSTREQKGSILSTPTRSSFMESERQRRREKGLCFRCGDPFRPGHRCSSSFSLMEIDDERNPVQEKLDSVEEQEVETLEEAEISFNAILGRPTTTTMKLLGSISSKEVLLLVDSGSTHNFISDSVVRDLNLPTFSIPTFGVQIGDGSVVRCNQICKGIEVMISEALLADPFTATIIQDLKENATSRPGYTLVERLYFNGRLVIPESSSLRAKLLEEAHNTPCGGHGGFLKTLIRLSNTVYWPRMKLDVKRLAAAKLLHASCDFKFFGRRPTVRGRDLDGCTWTPAAARPLLLGGGGTWAVATRWRRTDGSALRSPRTSGVDLRTTTTPQRGAAPQLGGGGRVLEDSKMHGGSLVPDMEQSYAAKKTQTPSAKTT